MKPRRIPLAWPERYERNTKLVEGFAAGESFRALATRFNLSIGGVYAILREAGIDTSMWRIRNAFEAARLRSETGRNAAIVEARELGETLAEIADRFHISRQRVHQIVEAAKRSRSGQEVQKAS